MKRNLVLHIFHHGFLTALVIVSAVTFPHPASGEEQRDPVSELEDQIVQRRKEAEYREALTLAKELLDVRGSLESTTVYEFADTRRLIATMELISELPALLQYELAEADSLQDVMDEHWYNANYREGAAVAKRQLAIRRRCLGDRHLWVSDSLSELGWHLKKQGNMTEAERVFRESLEIYRVILGEEHPDVAISYSNLAGVLGENGDYAGAETFFLEALRIQRATLGEEALDVATTLNNFASALKAQGEYQTAEPLLREALRIRREQLGGAHWRVANTLNNLADLLEKQGDVVGAEPLYYETLEIYRSERDLHPNVGTALNNLANLHHTRGDIAGADSLYNQALEIYERSIGEEHWRYADCLGNLALLREDTGDFAGAEPLHRRAMEIYRSIYGPEHRYVAVSLGNLAHNLYYQGDYQASRTLYLESLAMKRRTLGDQHWSVANTLRHLGLLLIALGDFAEAEKYLSAAATIFDAARLRAGEGVTRATFRTSPYALLAAARLELGNTADAWPAAERHHGRALADLLFSADGRGLTNEEIKREIKLKRILGDRERELAAYQEAAAKDTTEEKTKKLEGARNGLLQAEAKWSEFQAEIARKYPIGEGQIYAAERVQASLDGKTALIGWVDIEERGQSYISWAYVIRHAGPVVWARLATSQQGARPPDLRARLLRDALASPTALQLGVAPYARQLWTERIAPVSHALSGIGHLVVIPSGTMLGIPIEVLIDDAGDYLGETYAVSYTPSATIHTWLTEQVRTKQIGDETLLIGDPPFNETHVGTRLEEETHPPQEVLPLSSLLAGNQAALSSLTRLPETRFEVTTIASIAPRSHVLLGTDASEQNVVRLAESGKIGDFAILHIATHALVDNERPGQSALVLSQVDLPDPLEAAREGKRIYDGLVTATEIVREWDLNADLVTLSACETGLGKEVRGEGYVGFSHAVLQAGARSLLVSLWKVDDEATAMLMRRFYENLLGVRDVERNAQRAQTPKDEALREAKQWLRYYTNANGERPYAHPYYWAAFVLIGERG